MDVIVRSNYNPANEMTAHMSGLIYDIDKVAWTKSSQYIYSYIRIFTNNTLM